MDWTQITIAAIGLAGICYQAYCSTKSKNDKKTQTETLSGELQNTNKLVEENTSLVKENKKLIEENRKLIAENTKVINELKAKLSANDVATVAVVRQNIRRMYYDLLPHKMISVVDLRALTEMYNAYKAVTLPDGHHPNSWCDALYNEMNTWEKVEIYPKHLAYLNQPINNERE